MSMVEDKLLEDLAKLGLNERNYRALAVLPLVLVAWADGQVQSSERAAILRAAEELTLLWEETGRALLARWLSQPPSPEEQSLAMRVLVELARRQEGVGASLDAASLQDLIALCESVARAAGGMLGLRDPVSTAERNAITEIARQLSIDTGESWVELLGTLEG